MILSCRRIYTAAPANARLRYDVFHLSPSSSLWSRLNGRCAGPAGAQDGGADVDAVSDRASLSSPLSGQPPSRVRSTKKVTRRPGIATVPYRIDSSRYRVSRQDNGSTRTLLYPMKNPPICENIRSAFATGARVLSSTEIAFLRLFANSLRTATKNASEKLTTLPPFGNTGGGCLKVRLSRVGRKKGLPMR